MKPETKARAVVSLVVAALAFIMASGVGAFLGLGGNTTDLPDLNLTQSGELPTVWNSNNSTTLESSNTAQDSQEPQEDVYEEPASNTPTEPDDDNTTTNQTKP